MGIPSPEALRPLLEALQEESKKGPDAVYQIGPDDLLPIARQQYEEFLRSRNVSSIPIFVNQNIHDISAKVSFYEPNQYRFPKSEIQFFMQISEFNHRWTAEDVNKRKDLYEDKPTDLAHCNNPRILAQLKAMSQALGIQPPDLYIGHQAGPVTERTKKGEYYIILSDRLNGPFRESWSEEEQIAGLAHELGHIARQHSEPQTLAYLHNLQYKVKDARIAQEVEADKIAGELCWGDALSGILKKWLSEDEKDPKAYRNEAGKLAPSPAHPAYEDRIEMLRKITLAAKQAGTCPVAGKNSQER